jgi:hypothetical protein
MTVPESITESSNAIQTIVWPHLSKAIGGGDLLPVETVTDVAFAKSLDVLAGIDAWHVVQYDGKRFLRGIACRVQWDSGHPAYPFDSFTIRCDIGGGLTEYHKRKASVEHADKGMLYPHLTVQAYLGPRDTPILLQYAVVHTVALIQVCSDVNIENRKPMRNPQDGNLFWPVWWREIPDEHIRVWKYTND